jgi:hypothetical protein
MGRQQTRTEHSVTYYKLSLDNLNTHGNGKSFKNFKSWEMASWSRIVWRLFEIVANLLDGHAQLEVLNLSSYSLNQWIESVYCRTPCLPRCQIQIISS